MFAFLLLLFVLLVIYYFTVSAEGFNPINTSPSHVVNIPVNKIPAMLSSPPATGAATSELLNGSSDRVKPYDMPGQLPLGQYEQIAVSSPLPYQDTSLIKANRQQMINLLEMLKGFLAFEAQEIAERSDPTIQLPLQTARSDFQMLQNEVQVLNRNPGIQPPLTLSHLNDISSNLAFLQREVRLIGTAGPIQGPIYQFTKPVEGFQNVPIPRTQVQPANTPAPSTAPQQSQLGQFFQPANTPAPSTAPQQSRLGQVFQPAQANLDTRTNRKQPASQKDLNDFIARITAESMRLSVSGTTDPITAARVVALAQMKSEIQNLIREIQIGNMMESEIPVSKSELDKAYPILGKPSEPLPQLIKSTGLPPGLANLLPSNVQKDPATTRQIGNMVDKYLDTIVNGVSAAFQIKYTAPREAEIAHAQQAGSLRRIGSTPHSVSENIRCSSSTIDKSGFPSMADLNNVSNAKFTPMDRGVPITDRLAPTPMDAGRGASHFDWKARSKEIESQIKKRGLHPSDFGIMPPKTKVSDDFSWKGYARMICNRLQATQDPGLPETCGCPPMDWSGWRIAK